KEVNPTPESRPHLSFPLPTLPIQIQIPSPASAPSSVPSCCTKPFSPFHIGRGSPWTPSSLSLPFISLYRQPAPRSSPYHHQQVPSSSSLMDLGREVVEHDPTMTSTAASSSTPAWGQRRRAHCR
uniref:Uncharacterized protein n=1 Tax=Aegilops tauschii subsp. strangulata TaxID=200361 RepID=A0A453I1K2_AEGTS